MKKIVMICVLALALLLAACGSAPQESQQTDAENQQASEEAQEPEPVLVDAGEATAEDGQNPVMNFIGVYAAGRPSIEVSCEGADGARFFVTWSSSAWEHSEWVMSGKLDLDSLTVDYSNCVRKDVSYNEDGSIATETVIYENGSGRITFLADQNALLWADEQEHMADDLVFTFAMGDADPAYYSGVTAMDKTAVEAFAWDIRAAYLNEDWAALTDFIRYPITINGTELADAESFLAYMSDKTVAEGDRIEMENEFCHDMFFNGQGICMGAGEIWLLDPNYMTDAEPVIQIIAFNGIVSR